MSSAGDRALNAAFGDPPTFDRAALVAKMAEAMGLEQATARVEHSRRAGLEARRSMANAALDVICREVGLPDSVAELLGEPAAQPFAAPTATPHPDRKSAQ